MDIKRRVVFAVVMCVLIFVAMFAGFDTDSSCDGWILWFGFESGSKLTLESGLWTEPNSLEEVTVEHPITAEVVWINEPVCHYCPEVSDSSWSLYLSDPDCE